MKLKVLLVIALTLLSNFSFAVEGKRGFVMDVAVGGFFSPEIKSAKVISLESGSNAEKAGIKIGDELVSVYECKIPGCPAKEAKKMMTKEQGETLSLVFRREDNSVYNVELVLQ